MGTKRRREERRFMLKILRDVVIARKKKKTKNGKIRGLCRYGRAQRSPKGVAKFDTILTSPPLPNDSPKKKSAFDAKKKK